MPDDNDKWAAALGEDSEPVPHECGPYALALAIRVNSHRRQAHSDNSTAVAFDHDRREQYVAHDGSAVFVHRNKREGFATRLPQRVDKVGFHGLPERQLVDRAHGRDVIRRFASDRGHVGRATCHRSHR
jgi:hypothetical protein